MDILDRVPDPSLFKGLSRDMAEKWAIYLYVFPKDKAKKASLKTRTYALYDPQAKRDKFPAGRRFCANTYAGCPNRCKYCYANNYIVNADNPREKEGLLKKGLRDINDMKELGLSAVPLHISNSTDPFQSLEKETKTTFKLLRLVADNREQFTTVTILTKNPLLASCKPYLSVLRAIEPCQVEVSLIFNNDETRAFYEPGAPTVQSRLEGIRRLGDAGIKVSLRIDPLFPRKPLPKPFWQHPDLKSYGVDRTHTLEEIESLIRFGASVGCQKIIVSPLKVPIGYRTPCQFKEYFRELYAEPFGGKPFTKGFAYRLPNDYIREVLLAEVLAICNGYGIEMSECKHNLINTK